MDTTEITHLTREELERELEKSVLIQEALEYEILAQAEKIKQLEDELDWSVPVDQA